MAVNTRKITVPQSKYLVFGPRFQEGYLDFEAHTVTTPPQILVPVYGTNSCASFYLKSQPVVNLFKLLILKTLTPN